MDEKDIKGQDVRPKKVPSAVEGQTQRRPREAAAEGKLVQIIVFNLGDEEFCTDIDQVREIIRRGAVTPIPDSPDFIKGVTNVRGEIAVVIDLKSRFFLRAKKDVEEKHIVMTEQDKNLFGLMVDEVTEVLRIPQKDIKITPELVTKIDRVYISGVLTIEDRLIMMLDLRKVLSEEELEKLSDIRIRHRGAIEKAEEKRAKAEEAATTETADKKAADVADKSAKSAEKSAPSAVAKKGKRGRMKI